MAEMIDNPLFAGLSEAHRAALTRLATLRSFRDGEVILREGATDATLYVIQEGRAQVIKKESTATRQFLLSTLHAGEAFGEIRLVDAEPASADVVADGPLRVWCLDLQPLLHDPAELALRSRLFANLARVLASRLRRNSQVAADAMHAELEQAHARESAGRFVVALVAVSSACLLGIAALQEMDPARRPEQTWISAGAILVGGLYMYRLLRRGPHELSSFGLTLRRAPAYAAQAALLTLPVLAGLVLIKGAAIRLLPWMHQEPLLRPGAIFGPSPFRPGAYALALAVYVILTPLQEFFYRAGLQGSLQRLMPSPAGRTNWRAIIIANLVFASVHSYIGFRFAGAVFLPGLLWGWLFDRQRSLVGASVSHVLFGVVALFLLGMQAIVGGR